MSNISEADIKQIKEPHQVSENLSLSENKLNISKVAENKMKEPDIPRTIEKTTVKNLKITSNPIQGLSVKSSGSATGNPRNKCVLAPGHSLMDWIRLGSSGKDLTGVNGKFLKVKPSELAAHNKEDDAWLAINGIVFNVSQYKDFHPGGISELMKGAGKDATKLFNDVHPWVNYQSMLGKCVVGKLDNSVNLQNIENIFKIEKVPSSNPNKIDSESVKFEWRQNDNTISFYFTTLMTNSFEECRIRKINDMKISFSFNLNKTNNEEIYTIELIQNVVWPPICERSSTIPEIKIIFNKKDKKIWDKFGKISNSVNKKETVDRLYTEYNVLENTVISENVHLLTLGAKNFIQLVPPGKHIKVKIKIGDSEISRLYTPVPQWPKKTENISFEALDNHNIYLIIKLYNNGTMTPKLTALKDEESLSLSNSYGSFYIEDYDHYKKLHLIAGGSGLTPMLSIIKRALIRRDKESINLINFNRLEQNIFFSEQLDYFSNESNFNITQVITEKTSHPKYVTGQMSKDLLENLMGSYSETSCVFTCGPPGFVNSAQKFLQQLGWKECQTYYFNG